MMIVYEDGALGYDGVMIQVNDSELESLKNHLRTANVTYGSLASIASNDGLPRVEADFLASAMQCQTWVDQLEEV